MNEKPTNRWQALYQAVVGLALTSGLAALLFGLVAFNPKSEVYGGLPRVYALSCLIAASVLSGLAFLLGRRSSSH